MTTIGQSRTRTISVLRKNNLETIYVRVTDIGGTSLIDIRTFASSTRADGEPVATKSGICVPRAKLPELIQALQAAERAA